MIKISLPKSEIEKFLSLCSYVDVTNESMIYSPITEYILVNLKKGFCKLTLSSLSDFITYTFSCTDTSDQSLLISYTKLKEYYVVKRKDVLIITDEEKQTTFYDGDHKSKYSKEFDESGCKVKIELFPTQPLFSSSDFKRIERNIVDKLNVSKKYVISGKKDKLRPIMNVVSCKGKLILGTDSQISCLYNSEQDLGFSYFPVKNINLLSNFDYFDYQLIDNWNIIKHKTVVFGSKNIEGLTFENAGTMHETIEKFCEMLNKNCKIILPVQAFYDFCKTIKVKLKDETVNTLMEVTESGIHLTYKDVANHIEEDKPITCTCVGYEIGYKILFMHSNIIKVLDSLESSSINLSECTGTNFMGFWLDTDTSFHSICTKGI